MASYKYYNTLNRLVRQYAKKKNKEKPKIKPYKGCILHSHHTNKTLSKVVVLLKSENSA